ncbi:putative mitochondrial protein [Dendrobium catenatum]|uniref:Putative mitochondrial protein n=1 Tax=Dendrobium catenatum TaxID=906689 RepID=A0A2I0X4E7_9ASPA|nr:putative mitochondrial protein [Dendrobium catenatum]
MEQAYDSMSWNALINVLNYFNFPQKISKLIMECVEDSKFALIINGRYSSWIQAKSGFRQGCPLSPILFILCAQLLSMLFLKALVVLESIPMVLEYHIYCFLMMW